MPCYRLLTFPRNMTEVNASQESAVILVFRSYPRQPRLRHVTIVTAPKLRAISQAANLVDRI